MKTNELIDQIDELVDWQMEQGEHIDHPTNCPHCDREWHGLRLTRKIAQMYDWGIYDENYSSAEDYTPIVCEGSEFIGPMPPPENIWTTTLGFIDHTSEIPEDLDEDITSWILTLQQYHLSTNPNVNYIFRGENITAPTVRWLT